MSSTQMDGSNVQQQYEDFKPQMETQETADAHLLLIHLPGFTRQEVGANYEAAYRRIRVFGEKLLENNKRQRFSVEYIVPETCDGDSLKGKFEDGAKITITMPKKPISIIAPKGPEPIEEQEESKQVTTSKSASEVESEMDESQREFDEKKDEKTPTPPPEEATEESKMPQKDSQDDQKHLEDDQRKESAATEDSSITEKIKGKESEKKDHYLARQKSKEEKEEQARVADKSSGFKKQEKREEKGEFQNDQYLAREKSKKEEREESAMVIAKESSALKTLGKNSEEEVRQKDQRRKESITEKKEKNKEMDVPTSKVNNGNTVNNESSIGKGIRDMANSASQAATRLKNKFSEEDKQKLLCAGAAILVVVVGIYASFKLRSMTRQ
ncbi:protein RESTRICTED TEV MOVEMENT 2-like isoform X2 [Prosopis cineraria]|uniref:protein RESTRICTED TEV MOVEMENT 2-like isoform X2 n=1 Tax=Prosopis cineraria TaxID=364024 RepID=UPI00240F2240|nr:protein RESTRICTED TEV MOVEMENT 2-like isoform X2 [Prosopis cineraria]